MARQEAFEEQRPIYLFLGQEQGGRRRGGDHERRSLSSSDNRAAAGDGVNFRSLDARSTRNRHDDMSTFARRGAAMGGASQRHVRKCCPQTAADAGPTDVSEFQRLPQTDLTVEAGHGIG